MRLYSSDSVYRMKNDADMADVGSERPRANWAALVCLVVPVSVLFLNTTALNVALPALSTDLGAGTLEQQWIISVYNLVFAAALLPGGWLGDRFGFTRVLSVGMVMFMLGAAVAALAPGAATLMVGRAIMGCGASVFTPMSMALIPSLFAHRDRQRAMTVWTLASILATPLGPVLGGGLVSLWGWRTIFWFDVVAMGVAVVLNRRIVAPRARLAVGRPAAGTAGTGARGRAGRSDAGSPWTEAALVTAGVVLVTGGLIKLGDTASWPAAAMVVLGAASLAVFAWTDLRAATPFAHVELFGDPRYAVAALLLALLNVVQFGLIFTLPGYLQTVLGHNALIGGLLLLPIFVGGIVGGAASEGIARRLGAVRTCLACLGAVAVGLAATAWGSATASLTMVMAGLLIVGGASGAGQPVAMSSGLERIPSAVRGSGTALLNVLRQIGSVLGVAAIGGVQASVYRRRLAREVGMPTASGLGGTVARAFESASGLPAPAGEALRSAASRAYLDGLAASTALAAGVAVVVLLVCGVLARRIMPENGADAMIGGDT